MMAAKMSHDRVRRLVRAIGYFPPPLDDDRLPEEILALVQETRRLQERWDALDLPYTLRAQLVECPTKRDPETEFHDADWRKE
jgi:hypothetical protein